MYAFNLFENMGIVVEEMNRPMTLEEAIDILDPAITLERPGNERIVTIREAVAKNIVAKFAREKLKDEKVSKE